MIKHRPLKLVLIQTVSIQVILNIQAHRTVHGSKNYLS